MESQCRPANLETVSSLHWADITIIVVYFVIVLCIGLWSSLKARGAGVSGYFLAGRSMNWFLVGASMFGSNIGSEHFVGLAGSGAASGIAVSGFELNGMFTLVILGWVFLPVYIASGVYTMPEYLKKRFGGKRVRVYLAILALLLSVFTKIAADLFAGALLIKTILNWNLYAAILLQLSVACISTVSGGLRAVMFTDTIQVIIMVTGALVLTIIGFNRVGGYSELVDKYFLAVPSERCIYANSSGCLNLPKPYAMNLLRNSPDADLPWSGMVFGLFVSAVWYWCSDQVIVQRALSSKNYSHAKGGCVLTGFLKFLPVWLMVFPGMIARVLFPNEIGCSDPDECEKICFSRQGCTNVAYPLLVVRLLPLGLRGVMIAVLMSAVMSSLSSIFNSSSTIFTMDIWKTIRKNPSSLELLIVGRVFVIVMVTVAVLWIPVIAEYPSSQLFNYVQSVTSYLAPPVCATYVLAMLFPRSNEPGAFWGLIVGLVIGSIRFIMEVCYGSPLCYEPDNRPAVLKVHFLNFGLLLFFIVCIVNISVSLLTKPIDEKCLYRLTFWSRHSEADRQEQEIDIRNETDQIQPPVITTNQPHDEPEGCRGKAKKFLYFICGIDQHLPEGNEKMAEDKISLKEEPKWRIFTNIMGLILMTIGVFVYTFWA